MKNITLTTILLGLMFAAHTADQTHDEAPQAGGVEETKTAQGATPATALACWICHDESDETTGPVVELPSCKQGKSHHGCHIKCLATWLTSSSTRACNVCQKAAESPELTARLEYLSSIQQQLDTAITEHNLEAVRQCLADGADVNFHGNINTGKTIAPPLSHAVSAYRCGNPNSYAIVELLLNHPKIMVNISNNYGRTPLHCAAIVAEDDHLIKLLLSKGADPIQTDSSNFTPFHEILKSYGSGAVRLFLHRGDVRAHINDICDPFQRITPLQKCIQNAFVMGVRDLLDAGADMFANERFPLHKVAATGNLELLQLVREKVAVLFNASNINVCNERGKTALDYAAAALARYQRHLHDTLATTSEDDRLPRNVAHVGELKRYITAATDVVQVLLRYGAQHSWRGLTEEKVRPFRESYRRGEYNGAITAALVAGASVAVEYVGGEYLRTLPWRA